MSKKRLTFEEVRRWAYGHWGFGLSHANFKATGRIQDMWKSGFVLKGELRPGKWGWRRFATLKQVAAFLEYKPK